MPGKSGPARTYFTLREAFDFVGTSIYGPNWRGFEADCEPARAAQPTDGKTLLKVQGPDGRVIKRLPVPKRPIDDKHRARFGRAIGRHIKALKELLRLLRSRTVLTEFIPENATTAREDIAASDWPDPEKFNPKEPTWGDLWFNIAADRVVLKSPGTSPIPGRAHGDGSMWWAYGGRAGHVEIDREALVKLLRPPKDKGAEPPVPETPSKEKNHRAKHKRDVEADALLETRIRMVLAKAQTEWGKKKKRPGIRTMAKHLASTHGKELGFKFETIRQILRGTYSASERLGIPGL